MIVVGGSAGATAPLKEILSRLPATLPAAVFIVLHIPREASACSRRSRNRPASYRWSRRKMDCRLKTAVSISPHHPLRFRCQVGHAYTADVLAKEKEIDVDEGLAGCFVVLEERAGLVQRIANDARQNGRPAEAQLYEPRANEYRRYADIIRRAVLNSLDP